MEFDHSTDTISPDDQAVVSIGGTGGLVIPVGTTAQRPAATAGTLRYNTDTQSLDFVQDGAFQVIRGLPALATSGISAAGTTQGTATLITARVNNVTTVASGSGVILPIPVAGDSYVVVNKGANDLLVYPSSGGTVGSLAANAGYTIAVGKTATITSTTTTQWEIQSDTGMSGGGGGSLQVMDEGATLTSAAASINFVGAGVTSTNSGAAVTVSISGAAGVPNLLNCRVASTGNVTVATAPASLDGITLSGGDLVLLKDQTIGSENGLWVFNGTGSALTRSSSMAVTTTPPAGLMVTVSEGVTYANSLWMLLNNGTITVGATDLVFGVKGPSYAELTLTFGTARRVHTFSVAFPGIRAGDRVVLSESGYVPPGLDFDELEFNSIIYKGRCDSVGILKIIAVSDYPVLGQRLVNVMVLG
jgi:hypothetical protein